MLTKIKIVNISYYFLTKYTLPKMIGEENKLNLFKKLGKIYDTSKSITDILESFKCISDEYNEYKDNIDTTSDYSHKNFNFCTEEEKIKFVNDELYDVNCLVVDNITHKTGNVLNWINIYSLLFDSVYKLTDKKNRRVVYPTAGTNRPIGEVSYQLWNGFQIIDLDIKNAEITESLKQILFDELSKYHWFLGITKSASGKGLHLWTKITPLSIKPDQRKIEYICNFRHKYSYVYMVLLTYMNKVGYTKNNIYSYIDMAMAKPQQGIFIPSDDFAMMSTNFRDERLDVSFESAFNNGVESIDWISHPDLKVVFSKLEWFNNDVFSKETDINQDDIILNDRDSSKNIRKHYKHAQRWQLANTLTALYGADKALGYLMEICTGTDKRELNADIKTATIHNKPISVWAVNELNKYHGFNIEVKMSEKTEALEKVKSALSKQPELDLVDELYEVKNRVELHLKSNEYLSTIKTQILDNLSHISLLEAGAGYGKTEMVKSFGGKTLLILPFTSTIKAKVEADSVTADWLYYYGNKRPTLDELLSSHSMSMTIDKFSHLNVMELDQAQFDFIVIDESHLLFTSSYRDVMAPCIQRLANCKAKVIMMTGTPTGETIFFPNIRHIKVIKEDNRDKTFDICFANKKLELMIEMCKSMAQDVLDGKKVLFPTNNGNLYYNIISGFVQEYVNNSKTPRQVNTFYYKKSNYGDDSMENININKSIGNNDIILCTTYLSVGVDICDKYDFSIYFADTMIAQDIEQFANRIRNNDLHIKLFLPKYDDNDFEIHYYNTQRMDLLFNTQELMFARDILRTVNDVIERNQEESKYNPMIQSLLGSNRYLKYDENDCKYYVDETSYKLKIFEERYSDYAKQLNVIKRKMEYYGYVVGEISYPGIISEDRRETIEETIKTYRKNKYAEDTKNTQELLKHIDDSNIDLYRELLKGNYTLFKDSGYQEIREANNIYVTDIELMEKNLPIILAFYKYYNCDTIIDIYDYCTDKRSGRINYAKLGRIRSFANIEFNRRKKRLDFPVLKFMRDCQEWAKTNIIAERTEIDEYLDWWTVKYANSIRDLIVDDVQYLEKLRELVGQYWKIIIIEGKSKKKKIPIAPFELLWEEKTDINDFYGAPATREFFAEELLGKMTEDDDEEELPDFVHTAKYTLEQIETQLPKVIHADFDYFKYSEQDGSNDRFMRKQENTSKLGTVTTSTDATKEDTPSGVTELTFEFEPLPF